MDYLEKTAVLCYNHNRGVHMNNKIFIYLDNDSEEVTYDFSFKVDEYADITIDTSKDKNISAYLKMNKHFIEFLKERLKDIKKDKDYYSTIVKKTITHIFNLLSSNLIYVFSL